MSLYKPHKDRKKAIEDVLKDLDPATRELAKAVLENIIKEETLEGVNASLVERIRKLIREKELK